MTVQLAPINDRTQYNDDESDSEDDNNVGQEIAEYAEMEYFCQVSQTVASSGLKSVGGFGKKNNNNQTKVDLAPVAATVS